MLIIYAHPNKDGHCGYILQKSIEFLEEKNISYELIDLYAINYDPILKPEEHYTSGHRKISPENKVFQEKIKNERRFIFIYPTWWNSVPAILKGFIDRIFTSRFAFYYEKIFPKSFAFRKSFRSGFNRRTKNNQQILFSRRFDKIYDPRRFGFLRIKSKAFVIDNATKLTDKQKNKISKKVKSAIDYLL